MPLILRKTILAAAGALLILAGCAPASSPTAPAAPTNSGTPAWARTLSGSADRQFNATATDRQGNVYAAGSAYGSSSSTTFGSGVTLMSSVSGRDNLVLVKYDASGTELWGRSLSFQGEGSPGASHFYAVATDADGNVYAAGNLTDVGPYDFGNGVTVTGVEYMENAVLLKYDSEGNAQWARTLVSAASYSAFNAVAVGPDGVFAAGFITGDGQPDVTADYDFGDSAVVTANGSSQNAVLVKYDAEGTVQWARAGATQEDYGYLSHFNTLAADASGNVYVGGAVLGNGVFDFGHEITVQGPSTSRYKAIIVSYDSSGTAQWAHSVSGSSTSYFNGLALDRAGHLYAAGFVDSTLTYAFGNDVTVTGTAFQNYNAVLVQFDAAGTAQWARTVGSETGGAILYNGLAVDSSGNVFTAGGMYDSKTYDFGGVTAAGPSSLNNPVLVKYNSRGTVQWARTAVSSTGNHTFNSITSFKANLYVTAFLRGTDALTLSSDVTATGSSTMNALLVKYK